MVDPGMYIETSQCQIWHHQIYNSTRFGAAESYACIHRDVFIYVSGSTNDFKYTLNVGINNGRA